MGTQRTPAQQKAYDRQHAEQERNRLKAIAKLKKQKRAGYNQPTARIVNRNW